MKRVTGIGGIFFKAKDPQRLREWYRDHLGMTIEDWGGVIFNWADPDKVGGAGMTIWNPFNDNTEYFAPSQAGFMINYRVDDLDALLAALRAEGCVVDDKVEQSEQGRFGWVMDPENNRIELWQPPPGAMT